MTHQPPASDVLASADPERQVAQLREILRLVRTIAGTRESGLACDSMLDEAARLSSAYDQALPVVQRRFDALAAEAAGWAAAGVEALLAAGEGSTPRPAAARLASQLERALGELAELMR